MTGLAENSGSSTKIMKSIAHKASSQLCALEKSKQAHKYYLRKELEKVDKYADMSEIHDVRNDILSKEMTERKKAISEVNMEIEVFNFAYDLYMII